MSRVIGTVAILACLVLSACSSSGDTPEATTTAPEDTTSTTLETPPIRILFVGNSLTFLRGGLDRSIPDLGESATPRVSIEADESTNGGATFEDHWGTMLTPERIADGDYDIVVLQGDIPESDLDSFNRNARNLIEASRDAGAEPVLYMAWAYDRLAWITMDEIAQAHAEIAAEFDVDVAPVGLAFERALMERPELDMLAPDNEHQSTHGIHLVAFVIYMTLFDTDPPDTLTDLVEGDPITPDDIEFLLRVARETVDEYAADRTP